MNLSMKQKQTDRLRGQTVAVRGEEGGITQEFGIHSHML